MGKYIGVDWAAKGWFGIVLRDDGTWDSDLFPSIWSLWKYHSDASRIFVDIPIGLPATERRACDVAAKRKLRAQGRRVFYTPVREAVYGQNLEDAKATNEAAGYSIQNQAWSIVPRIREVDEFLDVNANAKDRFFETHPELCFYTLNDHAPVTESKHTQAGRERRRDLLVEEWPDAAEIYEACVDTYLTPEYAPLVGGRDDVLDALVAAVSSRRPEAELATLPDVDDPPTDERGLPMQISYPSDARQLRLSALGEE